MNKSNKNKLIQIRVSDEEKEIIVNKFGDNFSSRIRKLILNDELNIQHIKVKIADPVLLSELGRIGNNINQIAMVANTQMKIGEGVDSLLIHQQLAEINEKLSKLL